MLTFIQCYHCLLKLNNLIRLYCNSYFSLFKIFKTLHGLKFGQTELKLFEWLFSVKKIKPFWTMIMFCGFSMTILFKLCKWLYCKRINLFFFLLKTSIDYDTLQISVVMEIGLIFFMQHIIVNFWVKYDLDEFLTGDVSRITSDKSLYMLPEASVLSFPQATVCLWWVSQT